MLGGGLSSVRSKLLDCFAAPTMVWSASVKMIEVRGAGLESNVKKVKTGLRQQGLVKRALSE